jgi:hypothetical protein
VARAVIQIPVAAGVGGQGCRWGEQWRQNKQPNRNHQGAADADKMTKSTQELSSQRCRKFFS